MTTAAFSPIERLDRFCAQVLEDVSLHDLLRAPDDTEDFIALTLATARARGFELDAQDLREAMRHLPGIDCSRDRDVRETSLPPAGWLPAGTFWQRNELFLQWSYFGRDRLRDPFFEGSVQRCHFKPFNRLFRYSTPITRLADWLRDHPGLRPNGFIFHMSRSGSTLVSQMLASPGQNVVISEAPPIDAVVQAWHAQSDLSHDEHDPWLAHIVAALGQPRCGEEVNYFIKLDCWHTLALPLFRRVFPDVPWIFLYRDPVEVLVSQLKMPGMQMVPGMVGPNLFGLEASCDWQNRDDYHARVLARICEPALRQRRDGSGLFVNYRLLPEAVWTTILPHFDVECCDRDRAAMAEAARFDAKSPSFEFTSDSETKQRDASATTRDAADRWLRDLYRRLETTK